MQDKKHSLSHSDGFCICVMMHLKCPARQFKCVGAFFIVYIILTQICRTVNSFFDSSAYFIIIFIKICQMSAKFELYNAIPLRRISIVSRF